MSTATPISTSEYLNSSYRPDCDLIDGQLIERNRGEFDHSKLQGSLTGWFYIHQREWNIHVLPEQRVQVRPSRFRIPDVCIVSRDRFREPEGSILEVPSSPIAIPLATIFAELD